MLTIMLVAGCATTPPPIEPEPPILPFDEETWRGVHVYLEDPAHLPLLHRAIEEVMVPKGLNTLVLEVDYHFKYASHPEVNASTGMTREDARELAALCRRLNVRLIPQFQCFGHQGSHPIGLVRAHPELMVPAKPDYDASDHYHVSWNPLDPRTNAIVFDLIDELIDAFECEYFHVGLDEVMMFPDETTPHFNGENHAEVFAKVINDLHDHIVAKRGLTMLMWGDRLLDYGPMPYHDYESSDNGTAPAVDMIPTDIIICDWHYYLHPRYPSVPHFQDKGFRVWPTSWRSPAAALNFMKLSRQDATERMLGHLCSSWCGMDSYCQALLGENLDNLNRNAIAAGKTFHAVAGAWQE
jgi:glycosyl hydrolase family 20